MNPENKDFDGVFRFTNWTDDDFKFMWNNKEYTYLANKTTPMQFPNQTPEEVQEIRKFAAKKLAVREFYSGKVYKDLVKLGNKSAGGMPPIFDEKLLEPMIEKCLKPLPIAQAIVKEGKKDNDKRYTSKAISEKDNPNYIFKDDAPTVLGKVSEAKL